VTADWRQLAAHGGRDDVVVDGAVERIAPIVLAAHSQSRQIHRTFMMDATIQT